MESLEEKRKKVVNFCKSAFKPKYVEDMKKKFAPVVAEWDEETLDEWIRRGTDENVAERIFLEIEGITRDDEKINGSSKHSTLTQKKIWRESH
jgi:hypothetical protein